MKTTVTLALLLLALFAVSSLEADENVLSEEFEEWDPEDVSVNDFRDDEFDILSEHSCKGKKVKSHHHANGRCLPSECKQTCKKLDGFKDGKCTASEKHDKVKKCYCVKSCHKKHKKDKKKGKKDCPSPSSAAPADVPSSVIPEFSPADTPSSVVVPGFSPARSPSPGAPHISPILDFPVVPPTMGYASLEDDDADDSIIY